MGHAIVALSGIKTRDGHVLLLDTGQIVEQNFCPEATGSNSVVTTSTLLLRKEMQLFSVGHVSSHFLVVDVKESVHELNTPHFPNIKLLVFLQKNRKVSDAFPGCRPLSQLEWRAAKGCICFRQERIMRSCDIMGK